jgi:hypothetical protein
MRKSRRNPQQAVDEFNAHATPGDSFMYLAHPTATLQPVTIAGEAWVLGGHTAVVMTNEVGGCVALDALRAADVRRQPA